MKRKYQKPAIETVKINGENILAASMNWSPNGGNENFSVKEGDDFNDDDLG